MKLKKIFIFFLFIEVFSDNFLEPIKESFEITSISEAFDNVIEEFYVKNQIRFDVFIISDESDDFEGVKSKVLGRIHAKIIKTLDFVKNRSRFLFIAYTSAVIFAFSCTDYNWINRIRIDSQYPHDFKFLIYIHDCGLNDIVRNIKVLMNNEKLNHLVGIIEQFEYLLINDGNFVQLVTIEWFTERGCNEPVIKVLNSFNKMTQRWNQSLESYQKFQDFHGCKVSLCIDIPSYINCNGNAWNGESNGKTVTLGFTQHIFVNMSRYFNFTVDYSKDLNTSLDVVICYIVGRFNSHLEVYLHPTNFFVEIRDVILATPGELYTSYEKLRLPFDDETWTFLISTFLIAFVAIFIINRLPKYIQDQFYGKNVLTPTLNVISTFFGISQSSLPVQNIPRFILIMFVWFCLIFRTCYQSKLFEFMTSESRKPPPLSVEDLRERNYTLQVIENYVFMVDSMQIKNEW